MSRVRITKVVKSRVPWRRKKRYEITPESYAGPWELPEGTVLEVKDDSDKPIPGERIGP